MVATVQGAAAALPGATGRTLMSTLGGLPSRGLLSQFRFAEVTALSWRDDVSGQAFVPTRPAGNTDLYGSAANGGLILRGQARLILPAPLDVTQPWTLLLYVAHDLPGPGARAQELVMLGTLPDRGLHEDARI